MEGASFITPMVPWPNIGTVGSLDQVQNAPTAHTLPIAEAKAGLALDVMISLRNKTMEAYNELIKINV